MNTSVRLALLGSAISATTMIASAPAQAQCVVGATTITCASTTTTNTTFPANAPNDRNYPFNTGAAAISATVNPGAVVNGVGLSFTDLGTGPNSFTVTNGGTVQVDPGNTAITGGTAALNVTANGSTPVNYLGAGDVLNLGTGGSGLQILTSTGGISALVGGNTRSATGGAAIEATINNASASNLLVTTAAGKTVQSDTTGIYALINAPASTGTLTINNAAAVSSPTGAPNTLDFGIVAVNYGTGTTTLTNTGTVGSATDRAQVVGLLANSLGTSGAVNVSNGAGAVYGTEAIRTISAGSGLTTVTTGTGIVNGTTFGIDSAATGTGGITVITGTGAVTASAVGGVGINAAATTGPVNITTGGTTTGGAFGVQAASTGTQNISVNGVTSGATAGIHSNTTANRIITVGTAGNVTGTTQAILLGNTGTATINNSGTIGAASTGLALNTTGTGAVTLNNTNGIVNGRLTFNAGADLFNNAGVFNTQGTTDFGAGIDTLTNSGSINLTGATTFANLENFSTTGNVSLNTFTLTGPAVAFNNAGTLNTTGTGAGLAGFTALNNSGTISLAAGTFTAPTGVFTNTGTINAVSGATTITGQTNFANSGTLNLQDGVPNDVLTINSPYVGSGASQLRIDASGTAADQLVINGAASGTTAVNVNFLGGPILNPTGLLVVDTTTATAGAFTLGANPSTPLIAFGLEQRGADFFLTSRATAAAFQPLTFGMIGQDLWYQSADSYINMAAGRRGADVSRHNGFGIWMDLYASRDHYGDRDDTYTFGGATYTVDDRIKNRRAGGQIGADYAPGSGPLLMGLTAGYERNKAEMRGLATDYGAEGYNVGAYLQYAPVTGIYAGLLAKYDSARLDSGNSVFVFNGSPKLKSTGFDAEVGYRFGGEAMTFDFNAGLSHVRTKLDDFAFGGLGYDFDSVRSNRGRIGIRAGFGGGLGAFAGAKLMHEFNGDSDVRLISGTATYDLTNRGRGTWGRVEAGLDGGRDGGVTTALWADIGDTKGVGARLGFRF
jgi:outer membrane autotransporter protein